jgi:ribosomal protein S18 acetylase RimI-like enzyme
VEAELLVRQAVPDDLDTAVQVITEVSAWLAGKDISWLLDFPGPFKKRIALGEVYLAYLNDWKTLTGTVSLGREPDPELWRSYPGQARYVHRLAVRRKFAGRGIGRALLNLAGHVAATENVPWLRLDCSKDNQALQGYYLDQGFEHLDTVDLPHRLSGALFQRRSRLVSQIKKRPGCRFTVPLLADRDTSQYSGYPMSEGSPSNVRLERLPTELSFVAPGTYGVLRPSHAEDVEDLSAGFLAQVHIEFAAIAGQGHLHPRMHYAKRSRQTLPSRLWFLWCQETSTHRIQYVDVVPGRQLRD